MAAQWLGLCPVPAEGARSIPGYKPMAQPKKNLNGEVKPTVSFCRRGSGRVWRGKGFQVLILGVESEGETSPSSPLKGGTLGLF